MFFKKIENYFSGLYQEIRQINVRACAISGGALLIIGLLSWIFGLKNAHLSSFLIMPRCALPYFYAHIGWAISFFLLGVILGGILFGCEKFKRRFSLKIVFLLGFTYLFSMCAHPIFFGNLSPFLSFIILLASLLFCLLTVIATIKVYKLWSIFLIIELFWLIYNLYCALAFSLVN